MAKPVKFDIKDILDSIQHGDDYSSHYVGAKLDESITGDTLLNKIKNAEGTAAHDDVTGIFTGKRVGTVNIEQQVESLNKYKTALQEAGGKGVYQKLTESRQRELDKYVKNLFRDVQKGDRYYDEVIKAAATQEGKIVRQIADRTREAERLLKEAVAKETDIAKKTELLSKGSANIVNTQTAAEKAVMEHFGDIRDNAKEAKETLMRVVGDVEKETNLKFSDYVKTSSATEKALTTEAAQAEKAAAGASHWKGALAGGAAGAVLGNVMTTDPDKKAQNTAIGGGLGAGIGYAISRMMKNTKTALGAIAGPGERGAELISKAVHNIHR